MLYRILADAVLALHLAFVLFAVLGGIAVLRWRRLAWLHVPVVLWAALVEFAGWICPLTPLENRLRIRGGATGYDSGFIEHYLRPLLYPDMLTRELQVVLGVFVLLINVVIYARILGRRGPRHGEGEPQTGSGPGTARLA